MKENKINFSMVSDVDCFKIIISNLGSSVAVFCPLNADALYRQVLNALFFGNTVSIDISRLPKSNADVGEH